MTGGECSVLCKVHGEEILIRQARKSEFETARQLYDDIIDALGARSTIQSGRKESVRTLHISVVPF